MCWLCVCWHSARADAPQQVSKQPNNGSVHDFIAADIAKNPVLVYMKGTPTAPQCGFSNIVCKVLDSHGPARRARVCVANAHSSATLARAGVQYASRNVLQDAALREGIKTFTCVAWHACTVWGAQAHAVRRHWRSNWPTIPQVFIAGEFVGGSDILMGMHTSGELAEQLQKLMQK